MLFRKKRQEDTSRKCCVCGSVLSLSVDKTYQARKPIGPLLCLTTPAETFDCVNCEICGCQNVLNSRLPPVIDAPEEEPEEFSDNATQSYREKYGNVEYCVACDSVIPEGRQVCPICKEKGLNSNGKGLDGK